jgi:tRNA-Thr(GGU) m(6)t(6)A37 methyltransferase TsaA
MPPPPLTVEPIGVVHAPFRDKKSAPRQPRAAAETRAVIELHAGRGYEDALCDMERWTHLWVLSWLHDAGGWRPKVLPPRSSTKRGVFATRSPHRPNPIGLSVARLERVDGLRLEVREIDLLDGTPVLDLKPYVAWSDAIVAAGGGWLRPDDPRPTWEVEWSPRAREQIEWLKREGVDVETGIIGVLALGPEPHAYRRIKRDGDRGVLAWESWRAAFIVLEGARSRVEAVESGYRRRQLREDPDPVLDVHRRFVDRFG